MTMARLVICFFTLACLNASVAYADLTKDGCAVNLGDSPGDLHLLQANAKKVMPQKDLRATADQGPDSTLGDPSCPCIGLNMIGTFPFKTKNDTAAYPAKTGSSCQAWDAGRYPGCEAYNSPDFCTAKWCYVDPCNCNLDIPPKKSTTSFLWQGKPLYWSYATCGTADSFSDTLENACQNQKDKDSCSKADKCAWDGKTCVGSDIVDACKKDDLSEKTYGKKKCRCVGMAPKDGTVTLTAFNTSVEYPGAVGGNCSAWDDKRWPDCKKKNAPSWCKQKWCYVDPCDCDLGDSQPKVTNADATYQGNPAYWSYGTCGGKDEFTEDLSKLPDFPPAFCPGSKASTPAPTPAPPVDLGNSDCACVGLDVAGEIPITASVEDEMGKIKPKVVTYPASVGSSCKSWDKGLFPGCDVDDPPDWCSAKWCYVDPCKCSIPVLPKRSSQNYTYRGGQAYWSYSTCGDTDTFSAQNPMACVSQNNEDYCNELDGCAWDGEKCFGKEIVQQCKDEPKEEDYGMKTCRCVNREMSGYINITADGTTVKYPASLGANCSAWDDGIWPDCKGDDAPAWCKQKWCYVDPCDCQLDIQPKETLGGAMYKGKLVFWSYATCGGKDTFTEDPDKLPAFPPESCSAGDAAAGDSKSEANMQKPLLGLAMLALTMLSHS